MELQKSWAITRNHLEKARACIPTPVKRGDETESIENYQEFMDHNELELALEQLEGVGEVNSCPEQFWKELKLAALNMKLTERVAYYETKLSSSE